MAMRRIGLAKSPRPRREAQPGTTPGEALTEPAVPALEPPASRTLREAVLTWCSPPLVEAVRREECRLTEHQHAAQGLPLLSEPSGLAQPGPHGWMAGGSSYSALHQAWARLFNDLRQRVERRELFLEGVRLAPQRGTMPEEISNSWAADLEFNLARNTISLGTDRFGAIAVSAFPPQRALAALAPTPAPAVEEASSDNTVTHKDSDSLSSSPQRGRSSSEPAIRRAVLDYWTEIQAHVQQRDGQLPVWSELARTLQKRMQRASKVNSLEIIPHVSTIRTRLPRIYASIVSEKGVCF